MPTPAFLDLPADTNQARGIGEYAVRFLEEGEPSEAVLARTRRFHTDAALCAVSALALGTNAPNLLRDEAAEYADPNGATLYGGGARVKAEKAVAANASAAREWDSNGTNFGHDPARGRTAGEFGHNDYYSVPLAAAQEGGLTGALALRGMVLVDEIRGRLAEVFSLKTHKIDHVLHGAIASAATYAAMRGGTPEQIESAIGLVVSHATPWRAIRAGKQLSDSKGASAAISAEFAVLCARRALRGFVGPADVFRNPEALFRQFEPTNGDSPFPLTLSLSGEDFAVMGMHFKIGLYEHQSAGAIQAVIEGIRREPRLAEGIAGVRVRAYEPAFGIIGDPAKRDPKTRQSADHSMVFILARVLAKARRLGPDALANRSLAELWTLLMLLPEDYSAEALADPETRRIMELIAFEHGGADYDRRYPDGIPTSVEIAGAAGALDSGLVMYSAGHARCESVPLDPLLSAKWERLAALATDDADASAAFLDRHAHLHDLSAAELLTLTELPLARRAPVDG